MKGTSHLGKRMAGKWQLPLLLGSALALVTAMLHNQPEAPARSVEERMSEIEDLVEAGFHPTALTRAQALLHDRAAFENQFQDSVALANLHLLMARARAAQIDERGFLDDAHAMLVQESMTEAIRGGAALTASDHVNIARVEEWRKSYRAAVDHYTEAVRFSPPPALELRKRIIELNHRKLRSKPEEIEPLLDTFLADVGESLDLREWAISLKADLLNRAGRMSDSLELIEAQRSFFAGTERENWFSYLDALLHSRMGEHDYAERLLRGLRNRLDPHDPLYSRTGWLLGREILFDGAPQRPQEAISFFREVITAHPRDVYEGASHLGMAEALVQLERFDEALKHFDEVIRILPDSEDEFVISAEHVLASMASVVETLRGRNALEEALPFASRLRLLVPPTDEEVLASVLWRMGEIQAAVGDLWRQRATDAERSGQPEAASLDYHRQARIHLATAGETFQETSRLTTLDTSRSAAALWRAADHFDESGERERAISLLRSFVLDYPSTDLVPRAILRLGLSLHALGRYEEAIAAFQEAQIRFPRTPEAATALIPLAECHMAQGEGDYELAEKTLNIILNDSEIYTPDAAVFSDALFLLGDLLGRKGDVERAISVLEEALIRYPNDSRVGKATFLLGDAYRRSGLALLELRLNSPSSQEREQLLEQQQRRLGRAAELFGALGEGEDDPARVKQDGLDPLFIEYAGLYRADSLFHLQHYDEALEGYERAAWIYKDSPSALAAYVQIINCHLFQSQSLEAEAALRRALYLVDRIPEERFTEDSSRSSRQEWRDYFEWIDRTELF